MELPVLYRDEQLVAIHKPAGLLVHRSLVDRHETRFAVQLLRDQLGRPVYPVHRLDKPTAGVLLFALDPETARRLGEQFAGRRVKKTYLAVCRGWPEVRGVIDHPLLEEPDRMTDARARSGKQAQPARTVYRRLATVELPIPSGDHPTSRYALVVARPRTGRKHQLRRHFKHLFHPLIGDTTYGEGRHNRLFREELGGSRLLLAAVELQLQHPRDGRSLLISAPLDEDFQAALRRFGWQDTLPKRWLLPGPAMEREEG